MASTNRMTVPEFSAHIGCKRNYAYQLKKEGRLVMAEDGKHVLVAESIARIAATRDPSKAGVAARHAASRGAEAETGHANNEQNSPPALAETAHTATNLVASVGAEGDETPAALYDFQNAKAKREHWAAEREHAQYLKEAGELMERSAVVAAFADAGTTLRAGLEAWQVTLPPQLVGLEETAIRTTLADQVERLLHDLVDKLGRMAEQGGAA